MSDTILLLHGFAGRPDDFQPLVKSLNKELSGQQVLIPDLFKEPGIGPNQPLNDWVESFKSWLLECQPENLFIVGYSLGARLALNLLVTDLAPKIKAVVSLSGRPGIWNAEEVRSRKVFDETWSKKFEEGHLRDLNDEWQQLAVFSGSKPSPIRSDVSQSVLAQSFLNWSPAKHNFTEVQLGNYASKLFWLFGENDRVYQPVVQRVQQGRLGQVSVIADAGHRLLLDAPEAVTSRVRNILLAGEL